VVYTTVYHVYVPTFTFASKIKANISFFFVHLLRTSNNLTNKKSKAMRYEDSNSRLSAIIQNYVKGKAVTLNAWTGPEVSRRFRLPDFKTIGK
jgi:hypothetical protein